MKKSRFFKQTNVEWYEYTKTKKKLKNEPFPDEIERIKSIKND